MSNPSLFWEDRLKRGEHFVTNKVVKISDALGGKLPLGWSPFVESYIEGDHGFELWLRLTNAKGYSYDCLAVLKSVPCGHTDGSTDRAANLNSTYQPTIWQLDSVHGACYGDSYTLRDDQHKGGASMFVIVPEAIENPERMRVWVVPSFVRLVGLETSNEVYSRLREAMELFLPSIKISATFVGRKSQITQFRLGASRQNPKLPNKVVQNRTKVMDTIPNNKAQSQWRFFDTLHLIPLELINSITIYLGHHFFLRTSEVFSGLTLEIVQVLPCPRQTPMKVFKVDCHE